MSTKRNLTVKEIRNIIFAIVGLLGSIVTIWVAFIQGDFRKKITQIEYEISVNTDVFDINKELGDLEIYYKDKPLIETKESLKIVEIKIKNTGDENITKNHYDSNAPLGLKITNGISAERPVLTKFSNGYLKDNLKLIVDSTQSILTVNDVILDVGDFFTFQILVLHKKDKSVNFTPIGKISGINKILISERIDNKPTKEHVFFSATKGNGWIQAIRLLIYTIAFLLILGISILLYNLISNQNDKWKRKRLVNKFKTLDVYSRVDDVILNRFKAEGFRTISEILRLMNNPEKIKELHSDFKRLAETEYEGENKSDKDYEIVDISDVPFEMEEEVITHFTKWIKKSWQYDIVEIMFNDGYVYLTDNEAVKANEQMRDTLKKFFNFLRKEKYKENYPSIGNGNIILPVPNTSEE